jgi:hypothetical protein
MLQFPAGATGLCVFESGKAGSGPTQDLTQWAAGDPFLGIKWPGVKLTLSSIKAKFSNEYSNTCTPQHAQGELSLNRYNIHMHIMTAQTLQEPE